MVSTGIRREHGRMRMGRSGFETCCQWALPGARIFSYGYPSQLFFNPSVAGIRDYAMQLLQWLADERLKNMVVRVLGDLKSYNVTDWFS